MNYLLWFFTEGIVRANFLQICDSLAYWFLVFARLLARLPLVNTLDSEVNFKLRGDNNETLWNRISLVFVFTTFPTQSAGTESSKIMAIDRESQFFKSFILNLSQIDPSNGILEHFPHVLVVYLSWFGQVLVFFLLRIGHRIDGFEEYCLSSFFCIFSSSNQSCMDNRVHTERRTDVIKVLTPHVWNFHAIQQ